MAEYRGNLEGSLLQSQDISEKLNYIGAMADLDNLVDTVIRYLNGESSKERLESYIRLNYPGHSKNLT
jgi:hypothetical protein